MFHKMPYILFGLILLTLVIYSYLPIPVMQFFYALSLSIKSLIIFLLPFIIFCLLFKTMVELSRRATTVILLILLCVCVSNAITTFFSHYVGSMVYQFDFSLIMPVSSKPLIPTWTFNLPSLLANDKSMFAGLILGIIMAKVNVNFALTISVYLNNIVQRLLTYIVYLLPVFIIGFILKLQYDGVLKTIIYDYNLIFIIVACTQIAYVLTLFLILNNFQIKNWFNNIKNILPAAIGGFSTMSSAAVMPLTIAGSERNLKNKLLAHTVIPTTANIHLMGDCIAIPIFAYAVMKSYGVAEPSLLNYMIFVFYFVLAKFSVAAIPGGGILVMLPILHSYLGFNADMLSLITALYILFDPIITSINVMGNGAFAKLIDKILAKKLVNNHTNSVLITSNE